MPDGDPSGQGQVPAGQQTPIDSASSSGQVPSTTPSTPPNADSQQTTPAAPALTLEQALDALDKARREAAKNRVDGKRLADLEEAQRKAELDKLGETDRVRKELADLQLAQTEAQRKSQERIIRAEVRAHAATMGIPPELAGRLIDYAEIDYDDDGEPKNIGDLLKKLIKAYPQLVPTGTPSAPQPTSVGATPGNPARSGSGSGAISREYLDSLTPQQYAALSAERRREILQWMAQNGAALRSK